MSRPTSPGAIPPWTRADRLAKALRYADVSREEMAEAIGRDVKTVSNYTNDKTANVPRSVILIWAQVTGVDSDWLEHGTPPTGEISGRGPM